jgi:hypothetical protein
MISATHRTENITLLGPSASSSTSSASSTSSFAKELANSIEGFTKQSTPESRASEVLGQTSVKSQNPVTSTKNSVDPISAPTPTATTTTTTTTATSNIPTMLGMGPVAGTAPVQQSVTAEAQTVNPANETEEQAYWAAQPAAVQALQNMPVGPARDQMALQLANQGYSIDTQIMVWGWDPQMTMQIRENQGYSWVPSYGEANIPVGPGLSMPEDPTSYNPGNPPVGAIMVSTAFANGTIQNPLVQTNSSST